MTTLTLRYQRGHFTISGPDFEMRKFKSRREEGLVRPTSDAAKRE